MSKKITTPLLRCDALSLKCGESILLSGEIYTARDAAHMRLFDLLKQGKQLPFDMKNAIIYYVGPTLAAPGRIIGSAGPTSSYRMDAFTPSLIKHGMTGMIGKGKRNLKVVEAMKACGAVYFGAIGGAGALLAQCVKSSEIAAYDDLGAEAIRKLTVENMPLTVIIDSDGESLYDEGRKEYLSSQKLQ